MEAEKIRKEDTRFTEVKYTIYNILYRRDGNYMARKFSWHPKKFEISIKMNDKEIK